MIVELYRLAEVPDPDGSLADLLSELVESSALILVSVDHEAAYEVARRRLGTRRKITVDEIIDAALRR